MAIAVAEVEGVEQANKQEEDGNLILESNKNDDVSPLSLCTGYSGYCAG